MTVEKLTATGFRNFSSLTFLPQPGINVIYGENAQGKTNLLEALWLFCGAKSFRGAKDAELKGFDREQAQISCDYIFGEVQKTAKITVLAKRQAEYGGKPLSSAAELAGKFYAIVFSPLDLSLVNGAPAMRRRFLDTAIGQIFPTYNRALRSYIKAVEQRNRVLRDLKYFSQSENLLDDFEWALAGCAAEVLRHRQRYMQLLETVVPELYAGISGGREQLVLHYDSTVLNGFEPAQLAAAYKNSRKADLFTGNTSIGPHRDDLTFLLNGRDARRFGSQGQRRSIALALKLSEVRVIKKLTGEYPIVLLDDVMSELDENRQDFILNHILGWQVFLTCCDPGNIKGLKNGTVFCMKSGEITRQG